MQNNDVAHFMQMLNFAERVQRGITDISCEDFLKNQDIQDMILYRLGQIGEIAGNMDRTYRDIYPGIAWKDIIGLRQRLFHFYDAIDLNIVYEVTTMLIPKLINELKKIIESMGEIKT